MTAVERRTATASTVEKETAPIAKLGKAGDPAVVAPHPPVAVERALPFRHRLSLSITALIVLVALAGAVQAVRQARMDIQSELRSTMSLTLRFLDVQMMLINAQSRGQGAALPTLRLADLEGVRHLRVSFHDGQGRLIESSAADAGRAVDAPRWFVWLMRKASPPMDEVRRKVEFKGAAVGELVVSADASYEIDEIWMSARGQIVLLLLFCVLVNALLWWIVSRAMRPVGAILDALGEMGRGNLHVRLPRFGLPEMSRIGIGFNHMAQTLERSIEENTRLTRRLMQLQEDERSRLARELHDEIGQCVSAIHADAVAIRNRGDASVRESADAIVEVTTAIKEMVRGMLRRLRPGALDRLGLDAALCELVAGFRHRHPQIGCRLRIAPELMDLRGETAIAVYRMVQECLSNVSRHAGAHRVEIGIQAAQATPLPDAVAEDRLELSVRDDGCGLAGDDSTAGFGLLGMRERARGLGGSFLIDSEPGRGVHILAQMPVRGHVGNEGEGE
ncbi:MAG: histidine kinase [Panacagrimonas sp.]